MNMLLAAIEYNKCLQVILYTKSCQAKTVHPDDVADPRAAAFGCVDLSTSLGSMISDC